MSDFLLEMEHIHKSFPGVKALQDVTLRVKKGTVHALLGENGAGKSTLMKILTGMYQPDSGSIRFEGRPFKATNMGQVIKSGISMIYQELNPLPNMSVAENIYIGREPKNALGLLDWKRLQQNTREFFERLQIESIHPTEKLRNLTVAKVQMVEIAKAISYNSKLIIMDEPTSSLTTTECEHLFSIITRLRNEGITFIFISHKLEEVYEIADEATILRDGEFIDTRPVAELSLSDMIQMMVGREVSHLYPKEETKAGDVAIEVKNLTRAGEVENVSFKARKGEIVGFAGLMGAGRSELMETVFGYRKANSGEIVVDGKRVTIKSPADAIKNKMAMLTEDRKRTGLFPSLSVRDNMMMPSFRKYTKGPLLNHKKINEDCEQQKDRFLLKTPSMKQRVGNLSGGNQQKVLVSRWFLTEPEIIILDEPTRGIDIGAKSDIHRFISMLAASGKCIIMISSELPEILGMSDRIYVMHEGRLMGEIDRESATQEIIMEMATGINPDMGRRK